MKNQSRKVSGKATAKAAARKSFPNWIWAVVAVALIAIAAFALLQPGPQASSRAGSSATPPCAASARPPPQRPWF